MRFLWPKSVFRADDRGDSRHLRAIDVCPCASAQLLDDNYLGSDRCNLVLMFQCESQRVERDGNSIDAHCGEIGDDEVAAVATQQSDSVTPPDTNRSKTSAKVDDLVTQFAVGRCSVPTDQGHRICGMADEDDRDIHRSLLLIQSRTSEITPATRITRRRSPRARVVAGRIRPSYRMAGTATRSPNVTNPPTPGAVSWLDESYGRTETLLVLLRTHRARNTTSHDRYSTPLIA